MADLTTIEQQIESAIGQQETNNGTAGVGVSLNNPTAIKFAPWEVSYGASPTPSGFASFGSLQDGYAAGLALVKKMVNNGATVTSLINTWSPPSDGNTNNVSRISDIAKITGLDPTLKINGQNPAPATTSTPASGSTSTSSNQPAFSWSRIAAFLIGLACLIIGLLSLKQTQVVVQNVQEKLGKATELAAAF